MSNHIAARHALADYPVSLQSAATALWGDGFWGRYQPRPEARPVVPRR